jgi:hypothetical protein
MEIAQQQQQVWPHVAQSLVASLPPTAKKSNRNVIALEIGLSHKVLQN